MIEPRRYDIHTPMRGHRRYSSLMTDMQSPRLLEAMAQRKKSMENLESDIELPLVFSPPILGQRTRSIMKQDLPSSLTNSKNPREFGDEYQSDSRSDDSSIFNEVWAASNCGKPTVSPKAMEVTNQKENRDEERLQDMCATNISTNTG